MKMYIFILLFIFVGVKSHAQYSFSASGTGTITISASLSLNYTALVGSFIINDINSYYNGISSNNAGTLAVTANIPWMLKISANSTVFTPSGGGACNYMPSSVLDVRLNGTSTYLPLTTTSQTLNTGNSGSPSTSGNTFNIDMFFNPGFTYPGGNYSLGLVFTLTSQ